MRRITPLVPLAALCFSACQPSEPVQPAKAPAQPPATTAQVAAPQAAQTAEASGKRTPTELTTFVLYKWLNPIGQERDTFIPVADGNVEAKAAFSFKDRFMTVPLAASYLLAHDGTPRSYSLWGNTARRIRADDRVVNEPDGSFSVWRLDEAPKRVHPQAPFAIISGYAPMLSQELLLRTWARAGRPATLPILPEGTATFAVRGKETYDLQGKHVILEQVSVGGLVWGKEDVWLDEAGKLAAVATRDAEFDLFEGARDEYQELLPKLMTGAGAQGAISLADAAKPALVSRGPGAQVALVGAQLVDGTGRPPVKDAVIVYEGDKILAAGPRATTAIPPGAARVDVSGKTVIPGLWDMHAHYEQVEFGPVYLAAGVTTVRDMGNILEFITGVRDVIAAGKGLGPTIIADGLVDGEGTAAIGTVRIRSQADIVPVLDRLQKAGCPEVKIYSSVSPALVRPIAAEAHRRGMRVVGHVPEGMSVLQALDAGYDGISHSSFLFDALVSAGSTRNLSEETRLGRVASAEMSNPILVKELDALVAKKAFIDDTTVVSEPFTHTTEELRRREPGMAKLPRELVPTLQGSPQDQLTEARSKAFDKQVELLRELHRRKVLVVAGTDQTVPGHSLHRELELYVEAGFTPMEAIQAATSLPARIMHLDKQVGTIAPGKRADLVIVAGDPLANIHDIRKVAAVVTRGRTYDPAALWRLADFQP